MVKHVLPSLMGWSFCDSSQLGLGSSTTLPCVFVPTETPLSRAFPSGTLVRCTDIAAGESL